MSVSFGHSMADTASRFKSSPTSIYNVPAKQIILPGLLIGNMAYKLGTEKNPQRRSDVFWNSVISWVGGALLFNTNNKLLPYFTLPAVAGSIALFKIAQKDTPEEKTDTAINHASWWLTGMATQSVSSKLFKLKGGFNALCAFAVGASVIGPVIATLVKDKVLPMFGKDHKKNIGSSFESLKTGYNVGQRSQPNFSPFSEPSPLYMTKDNQRMNLDLDKGNYDSFDPFNIKGLIPGGPV